MIENVWEFYGLKENPFSISPLLVQGGVIPVESFVGRDDQLKRLGRTFGSPGGSRTVVYGEVGVGKTSFVNVARRKAFEKGFFTPFVEIAVLDDWDAQKLILNTLSSIYSTLRLMNDRPISENTYKKLESLTEIAIEEKSVGVSLGGWGGNYGVQRKVPQQIPINTLIQFFKEIIEDLKGRTKKDVIIHYNNLELMSEEGARNLFSNLRDFLQTANVHFVFVGNASVNSIIQSLPRVSSIFSDTPIHIENLSLEEIKEILRRRVDGMKISNELT
jgi:Cdc6-like AAA superfamily ATPase